MGRGRGRRGGGGGGVGWGGGGGGGGEEEVSSAIVTDPRHFRFRFSLTTPPAVASSGVHLVRMRPTQPRGQSDCMRQHLATNHRWQRARRQLRRRPRPEEASSLRARLLRLNPGIA